MRKILVILLAGISTLAWADEVARPIRVGLLLPLQVQAEKRDLNMDRFVDFYSGALLAVYEMQATGQPVEIHTYDIGKSTNELEHVLAGGKLDSMDMIIGPVYTSQVRIMAGWSKAHKVKTLLPFSSEVPELSTNPYLLQFNPSYIIEAEAMAETIASNAAVKCIFVESNDANTPMSIRELQRCIKGYALDYAYTTIGGVMADSLTNYLADGVENILLLNTERYANLRLLLPHITRAAQGKKLTLLSRYAWQEEAIVLPQLYTTVFRQEIDSMAYNQLYHRFYKTARTSHHPCYDLLGYDLMTYTLYTVLAIHENEGVVDEEVILSRYFSGLQSDMLFERIGEQGGYQNRQIYTIRTE